MFTEEKGMNDKIYPRTSDNQTVYLKNVVTNANIEIGDYTMYNDFVQDPLDFEKNNVLYHYPINKKYGKYCFQKITGKCNNAGFPSKHPQRICRACISASLLTDINSLTFSIQISGLKQTKSISNQ